MSYANTEYQRLRLKTEQKRLDKIMKLVRSEVSVDTDHLYHLKNKENRSLRGAKADALKYFNDFLIESVVSHQLNGEWEKMEVDPECTEIHKRRLLEDMEDLRFRCNPERWE